MSNDIPRRAQLWSLTPAELAIRDVVHLIEKMGGHPMLTEVVVMLGAARDKLADYIDQTAGTPGTTIPMEEP